MSWAMLDRVRTAVFVLIAALAACRSAGPPAARAAAPQRIVLVTIDTWRWDAIGASGSGRVATPVLDGFAKGGLYCAKAWTSATLTAPAHASILTGLSPYRHGIRNNHGFKIDPAAVTLAEALRDRGFATAAFVSAHPLARVSGCDRGFDVYDDRVAPGDPLSVVPRWRKGADTVEAASRWLRTAPDTFFLWVHLYEPHDPYEPPEPHRTTYRASPYFGEAAYADELVGRLKGALGPKGERDALWVITGDHGEALDDHGEATHSLFVYDATARVPLIVWSPGAVPASKADFARVVDVAPTVLALLGATPPAGIDGRALIGAPATGTATAYVETLYPYLDFGAAPVRALSDGRFKVIDVPQREVYDLTQDPGEAFNLAGKTSDPAVAALSAALAAIPVDAQAAGATSEHDAKALRSLGYIGAGGDYAVAGGMDPKAFASVYKKLNAVRGLADQRRFAEALPLYVELAKDFPKSSLLACERGLIEMALGKAAEAKSHLKQALERNPKNTHALLGLANLAIAKQDLRGAEARLLEVLELDPDDVEANFNLGALYYQSLRQPAKAAPYWQRFLVLQPDDPEAPRIRQLLQ